MKKKGSVRSLFVKHFGEADAKRIEAAAMQHDDSDEKGSDPFKWALCIAIGHECFGRYRAYHGFKASAASIKKWIKQNGHLETHDGAFDTLALFAGAYADYLPKTKVA